MSVFNYNKDNLPISAYLRADPHNQHYNICEGETKTPLISDEAFWGDNQSEKLYLHYSEIPHRILEYSYGLKVNPNVITCIDEECDRWIEENLIRKNLSNLYVIQGYAGCGKSTFIHYIVRKYKKNHYTLTDILFSDISEDTSPGYESSLVFNGILNSLIDLVEEVYKDPKHTQIMNQFRDLCRDSASRTINIEINNATQFFKPKHANQKLTKYLDNIRENLDNKYGNFKENNKKNEWHNKGNVEILVSLIILLHYARRIVHKDNEPCCINLIYDNLDAITDPAISSEIIYALWGIIFRYKKYMKDIHNPYLPNVKIIVMVRKILRSYIVSFLPDLEMSTQYDPNDIINCDISYLYPSKEIMEHRINYWNKLVNDQVKNKLTNIQKIIHIQSDNLPLDDRKNAIEKSEAVNNPDVEIEYSLKDNIIEPREQLNLDALFNHNYRAFSNILSAFTEQEDLSGIVLKDYDVQNKPAWQKVATIIYTLSLLYSKNIWNTLGFGCANCSIQDYPTTLNRLILNILYVARKERELQKYINNQDFGGEGSVSLKYIVDALKNINFIQIDKDLNDESIKNALHNSPDNYTQELIIKRLAEMCARNPLSLEAPALGYDSEEQELWRRPMYFVEGVKINHTASTDTQLMNFFRDIIDSGDEKTNNSVKFSITDEGTTLIEEIFPHFEFYSGRYSKKISKPLHQATDHEELIYLINPVYEAVEKCCIRTKLFLDEYAGKYHMTLNEVLDLPFHPRTKPRFEIDNNHIFFRNRTFRSQIHTIRIIFSHLSYLTKTMEYFKQSNLPDKNNMVMELKGQIQKYLDLYMTSFEDYLNKTTHTSDNNVYYELKKRLQ